MKKKRSAPSIQFPILGYSTRFVFWTFVSVLVWTTVGYVIDVWQLPQVSHFEHLLVSVIWIVGATLGALVFRYLAIKHKASSEKDSLIV